ncbi:MAG: hypothetical protein VYC34_06515, partial [Planctomycetota bacterium]|nr:hypothetical protein [Planctomycetota bacterium]
MDQILDSLSNEPGMIMGIVIALPGMLLLVAISWIWGGVAIRNKREVEQSRRELAAYVAEGSISAEDAEILLQPRP